ncbi:acyl-CoA synthetase [Mycobacterium terramassiliense]|uniref:acyl-CoA synthetase n=1 Tax=Mycobacterium terramassiliense TaxID=1841859 RepID=UPI00097D0E6A|nr:acyl-CoA synthetase [Mycobacterium terramassiliense]
MNGVVDPLAPRYTVSAVANAIAAAIAEREFIVQGDKRLTYLQVVHRANRLARFLNGRGLGCHTDRRELANHQCGQDLLGIYALNGNEYIEGMLAAFGSRVAPFNINYRYVKDELTYLLADSGASALLYHGTFAPRVAEVLPELPHVRVLIQIADASDHDLLPGAVDYESIVGSGRVDPPDVTPSPDDLYVLYTGGTTGRPKGVLWRQHDIFVSAFGGRDFLTGEVIGSCQELVARAAATAPAKILVLPPLMHGAAQWSVLNAMTTGQTVVLPTAVDRMDAEEVVNLIDAEQIVVVQAVGDAMARPVLAAAARRGAALSSVAVWANGGAALTSAIKHRLAQVRPGLLMIDGVGSSEAGQQMRQLSSGDADLSSSFTPGPDTCVASEDLRAILSPGHEGMGWLAQRGFVPLGYLGDAVKTAATFPEIQGHRYSIPGDRARHLADGSIELLGRDSVTINSGGEKIFAEEVEAAIASHPAVADVVVAARPSERWGQEVVAIVALTGSADASAQHLIDHAAKSIARYKLPKAVVFRDGIERSPAGKPDYRWAYQQARNPPG